MRAIIILLLCLLWAVAVSAQTNKGGISGTVVDANGAAIPGAKVTITNLGTNQAITLTTSETGAFNATSLDPVSYSVVVEVSGFKKGILAHVKVDTSATATANIALETGKVEESVTITADAPLLNTESGTATQTITERQLQDVPLFNRSVLDLAVTVPNVTGDVGSEDPPVTSGVPAPGFNLSLNGGRPGSTSILADGANNTGVGVARQVVSFSPETVQEFTVQTSAYSAEYGNTGGGVINATTKSGTNQLNGQALWYMRNPATNAQVWTNGALRPPNNLRTNQVAFTIGGPIVLPRFGEGGKRWLNGKNKSFFFFAVEPRWRNDFVVTDTLLPTDAMRAGDFSGLTRLSNGWAPTSVVNQFPSVASQITDTAPHIYQQFNIVNGKFVPLAVGCPGVSTTLYCQFPADKVPNPLMDPIALKALAFLPHAGSYFLNANGQLSNFVVNRFVQQNEVRYTTRIDQQLSSKNRLTFRLSYVPAVGVKGFGSDINGNAGTYSNSRQILLSDNHIFSPTFVNELRLNYTRGVFSDDFGPEFSVKTGRNLSTELGLPSLTPGGMPLFNTNADGVNAFASIGAGGSTNNYNVEEQYNITDVVYWNRGNHGWKMGVELDHKLLNVIPFFGASGGRWDFRVLNSSSNRSTTTANGGNIWASYLLGVPNSALVRPALYTYYYRWNSGALFVQDDWKVRPNLTVNLGLRYSLQLPRTEKNNLQGVFRTDLSQSIALPPLSTLPAATQSALNLIQQVTGHAITSAVIPAFAFAGQGGRSRYLYDPDYTDFEPRFGFAYSPRWFGLNGNSNSHSVVIRGGYGISHYPLTGNNRLPNPDFGATVTPSTTATGSTGTANLNQPLRFSDNPPFVNSQSLATALGINSNGLVFLNGLGIPGVVASNGDKVKTPYVQNWNLTLEYELSRNMMISIGYTGSKGTHLFLPQINVNPRDFNTIDAIEAQNSSQNSDTAVPDPLGRRDLSGNVISVPIGSLATPFLGFNHLFSYFNSGGDSIRHGMYIFVQRRLTQGLQFTVSYTYGKSIDNASDASPDKNILSGSSGSTLGGHVTFGAPLSADRAVSAFDITNSFASTVIYDLPFGNHRRFLSNLWKPLDVAIGGWAVTGIFRLIDGAPFFATISDTNRLSADLTHTIRPDIVPGVPLVNPNYSPNCKASTICEPYVNPAAFVRPIKGSLGNAPRTLDVRGPIQRYLDMSFQKNFPLPFGLDGEGKRRVQFRVDLNNAFNHPNFRVSSGNAGPDFMGLPTETPVTQAELNAWLAFNPGKTATLAQVQALVINNRLPSGALPLDYFHIQLPDRFATTNANAFDITTLNGYKLYRLRQAYSTSFGQLRELGLPRYIQFGIKLYF